MSQQPTFDFGPSELEKRRADFPWGAADARRPTQRERILSLLAGGEWIPLPKILALNIAQFGARILELRRDGHNIENRVEEVNGETHSWYRLIE